ncbi:LysR family transcriptional regulator [Cupriavidus sp. 30B13]|uniref:LysR family transcriptional regulator n=1 Tax=Cupriavidus sp. 30B13 TaxID=3384241 RepID=UPI003B8EC038
MDISQLKIFSRVARLKSFSGAARELSISQSQASRAVSDLEQELGVSLLARTTRAVIPTEEGTEYLARIEPVLDQLDEAEQSVRRGELRGTLRIGMPTSAGVREIIPLIPPFAEMHPKLSLQVILGDRKQDLVRDAVDVALRMGMLPDSNATARLLTTYPRLIVAAPGYLDRYGTPPTPSALPEHRIVHGPAGSVDTAWAFSREGTDESVSVRPSISFNDNEGVVAATVAGMGIASIGLWACRRELEEGRLVRLLSDWDMVPTRVYAYYPLGKATRYSARAFIHYLSARLEGIAAVPGGVSAGPN